jgi:hypothetical protein
MWLIAALGVACAGGVGAMVSVLTADLRAKRTLAKAVRTQVTAAVDGEWIKVVGTLVRDPRTGQLSVADDTGRAFLDGGRILGSAIPGQRVAAFGWASWGVDPAAGDYREPAKKLVLRGEKRSPVTVTADPQVVDH